MNKGTRLIIRVISVDWKRSLSSFSLKNFILCQKAARAPHFSSASGPLLGHPSIFQWLTVSCIEHSIPCGTCHITSYSFYLSRTAAAPLHHQICLPLTSFTQHLAPLIFSFPFFTLMHRYHVHSFSFFFILSYSSTVFMPEFDFWLRITLPSASAPHRTSPHLSTPHPGCTNSHQKSS